MRDRHAIVVGSGPNGLAAGVALAREGWRVEVLEANQRIGGACRTQELTLPGFRHDLCSGIHPLGLGSPFFRTLPLEEHGLEWVHPDVPLAHPLDDEPAALLHRSVDTTARDLGVDGPAWRRLMGPLVDAFEGLSTDILAPLHIPAHPLSMLRFGLQAIRPATSLCRGWFETERARALFAGIAGHSFLPLDMRPSSAFGLVLGIAGHAVGWPMPRGGAQAIPDALASLLVAHGGTVHTGRRVRSMADVPDADAILFDLTPRQLLAIAGDRFPPRYQRKLARYRYAPGAFKLDWALDGPIPWRDPEVGRAGTVHLGATLEEMARSERDAFEGRIPERPFVLLAQHSLFDPTRAPEGKHTAWGYCHVPNGSTVDVTDRIEAQIERFAPGFRDRVLARSVRDPADLEAGNANLVGGDINGGLPDLRQLFFRPTFRLRPYTTPDPRIFVCSASSPPGGGVHGMCGFLSAQAVMARFGR